MVITIWNKSRKWLPGLVISLLAILILWRLFDWREVGAAFSMLHWTDIGIACGLFLVSMMLRVVGWKAMLQHKASYQRVILVLNEGYLLNNLFPFRLGELGRALLMSGSTRMSPLWVLSTIVIERSFDLAIAAGFLLSTLPFVLAFNWAGSAAWTILVVALIGLTGLYSAVRYKHTWRPFVERTLGRWDRMRRVVLPRIDAALEGFSALTNVRQFSLALGGMLASWLLGAAQYYILLRVVAPQAEIWWPVFVLGVAAVGVAIPSAPASLGVFEASVVGGLALLEVPGAPALAFAITAHLLHIVITGVIGLYGLSKEGETLTSLYQRVTRFRKEKPSQA